MLFTFIFILSNNMYKTLKSTLKSICKMSGSVFLQAYSFNRGFVFIFVFKKIIIKI